MLKERCQSITEKGSQCKRPALPTGRFCPAHEKIINGS